MSKQGDDTRRRIVTMIRNFIDKHGYSPTVREIAAGAKLKSTKNVVDHLRRLEEDGVLTRGDRHARSVRLSDAQSLVQAALNVKQAACGTVTPPAEAVDRDVDRLADAVRDWREDQPPSMAKGFNKLVFEMICEALRLHDLGPYGSGLTPNPVRKFMVPEVARGDPTMRVRVPH